MNRTLKFALVGLALAAAFALVGGAAYWGGLTQGKASVYDDAYFDGYSEATMFLAYAPRTDGELLSETPRLLLGRCIHSLGHLYGDDLYAAVSAADYHRASAARRMQIAERVLGMVDDQRPCAEWFRAGWDAEGG